MRDFALVLILKSMTKRSVFTVCLAEHHQRVVRVMMVRHARMMNEARPHVLTLQRAHVRQNPRLHGNRICSANVSFALRIHYSPMANSVAM